MRNIPSELADRIEGGAATMCHAWVLARANGVRLGFTDHDRDLAVDGVLCRAASGWTAGAAEGASGLTAGSAAASGALDDDAITESDIAAGLYDGAQLAVWRVDWAWPDLKVRLWTGRISRLVREGKAFTAELDGPMAALERVVGRTYGRGCDAVLGDARCGVNLADHPGAVCDKRWASCVGVFANGARFRGFPDIPGDDFLTAYPAEGGRHDGGRPAVPHERGGSSEALRDHRVGTVGRTDPLHRFAVPLPQGGRRDDVDPRLLGPGGDRELDGRLVGAARGGGVRLA